ncbi:flagellar brake protein YcgR [Kluyvera genomosp. 1]|uniref:flagellar brake protein YcgR n=1 Tax=Kluyvera genomosp. 1 TaxID=2774053 RepID=UPI0006912DAE|nr:flagellar brake protein [Kluyvera genomosp. 1]
MSEHNTQFLKQNPLAVLNVLRDLQQANAALRVSWSSRQFISRILDVSQQQLIIDFGSREEDNNAALLAKNLSMVAETNGAKIEFSVPQMQVENYQGLPAFVMPTPPAVWFIQRREYFRIPAPLYPPYYGCATLPDKKTLRFRLFDLSLGGMGALLDAPPPETLLPGMEIKELELDMGQWGRFRFDVQLLAISERKVVDSKNETIVTPRLSFRFLYMNPVLERSLQRIIFSLEREARERANNVR